NSDPYPIPTHPSTQGNGLSLHAQTHSYFSNGCYTYSNHSRWTADHRCPEKCDQKSQPGFALKAESITHTVPCIAKVRSFSNTQTYHPHSDLKPEASDRFHSTLLLMEL